MRATNVPGKFVILILLFRLRFIYSLRTVLIASAVYFFEVMVQSNTITLDMPSSLQTFCVQVTTMKSMEGWSSWCKKDAGLFHSKTSESTYCSNKDCGKYGVL
jgi:hypothetical protein